MAIVFNEDPNHYIFSRCKAGVREVHESDLREFIRQYRGSNISDFIVCVGYQPFYKTKRVKSVIDRFNEWEAAGKLVGKENDIVVMSVKLCRDAYESGLDIFGTWIDEIRACGMRPWISIRMNDIHNAEDDDAFLPSDFAKNHPEYKRVFYRKPSCHPEYTLDYTVPAVRQLYYDFIEESLETYDSDGIELDFMREPFCFAIGREQQGIKIMTEFVGKVVALVRETEKRRGHKIQVAVRVPSAPRDAMLLGLDVTDWLNRGYIDRLFVTPHWTSCDGNMPIDLWKSIIGNRNIRLAAGQEFLIDAYNRRGRKYTCIDEKSALGYAEAYNSLGADDVYLFNYMDCIDGGLAETVMGEKYYMHFLHTAGDADKMIASSRRHVATFFDTWIPGEPVRKPLPFRVSAGAGATSYTALRIPTGVIPADKKVTLVYGFERGQACGEDVDVYANCRNCRCLGKIPVQYPQYDDMDYYAYEIENDGNLPTVFMAEIGALRGTATVHWAEIDVE